MTNYTLPEALFSTIGGAMAIIIADNSLNFDFIPFYVILGTVVILAHLRMIDELNDKKGDTDV